jgi:hypothetical protein
LAVVLAHAGCHDDGDLDPTTTTAGDSSSASASGSSGGESSGSGSAEGSGSGESGTTAADSSGGETTTGGPDAIELGAVCPLDQRIGEVSITAVDEVSASVYGRIFDKPDPWIGPAELDNGSCAFHAFQPGGCEGCSAPQVCAYDGRCVDPRLAYTDASLTLDDGSGEVVLEADPITGDFYGTAAPDAEAIALTLRFGPVEVELPAMTLAADLPDLAVALQGEWTAPMAFDATWTPRDDDSRVHTVIPINHHAQGPTFTVCDVPSNTGAFHAEQAMLVPLAVVTGLEYQGTWVSNTAAVHTSVGCVDVRLGRQADQP